LLAACWPPLAPAQTPPLDSNDPQAAKAAAAVATTPRFKPEQIDAGRDQFHRTCSQCHGRNMVTPGTTVYDLRKFPLDQADRFQSSVTNGKGNMPSFKEALSPEQIGILWAYVGTRGGKEP
jgi:mono/diheme cytochrome c family protein